MLFQLIAECMKNGKRACIATPRIDVVNELFPRFQAAFAEIEIGKYHGREFKEPGLEQLTICTTHQLMKFYEAFDLTLKFEFFLVLPLPADLRLALHLDKPSRQSS